ncbi:MAG: hypothetical protein AAF411_25245, partial [Myxococcota bacterium]
MTRAAVLLTGAAGLAIVLRAAAYYSGVDSFAFAITVVMAFSLCAGVIELLLRARRVAGLHDDLRGLVAGAAKEVESASKENEALSDLGKAPEGLRAVLRSHLERDPMPTRAPLFTPYLIGLLVMLGLLGTFLGLFETLRGAREALSTGADVDALRAGLATPMAGLMRSFGTSAAGVACSAMLGLGAVFVRRSSRAFDRDVHRACAGVLAHLSAARRQLTALVALAEQGESLPRAAASLDAAAASLRALRESADDATRRQETALTKVGERLGAALDRTVASLEERLESLDASIRTAQREQLEALQLEAAAARAAASEAASAAAAALETSAARLSEGLGEATSHVETGLRAATLELSRGFEGWTASAAEHAEVERAAASANFDVMMQRLGALEEAWRSGHARAAEQVQAVMHEGIAEATKAASESVQPTVARIVEATEQSAASHLRELRRNLEADAEARRGRDEAAAEALA